MNLLLLKVRAMAADKVTKTLCVSFSDVQEAMGRIRQYVHYTPMMQCSHLDSLSGYQLHFKCEMFQKTGAFKVWHLVISIIDVAGYTFSLMPRPSSGWLGMRTVAIAMGYIQ